MTDRTCTKCGVRPALHRTGLARCAECKAPKNDPKARRAHYERSREGLPRRGDCAIAACKDCGVVFQFFVRAKRRDTCDACRKANGQAAVRAWAKRNPERVLAQASRDNRVRQMKRHGLPLDTVRPSVCECCGREAETHADHDHDCCPGKYGCGRCFRGWLCTSCNQGLGRFRDDPDLLRAAAAYLERKRGQLRLA